MDEEDADAEALEPGDPDWLQNTAPDPEAGLLCILCILGGNQPACGADGHSYANACFAACEGGGAVPAVSYWPDEDGDGFGDASATPASACKIPDGASNNGDDCDDADDAVSPGSPEACDGVDNDCDAASRCDAESCADIALEDPSAIDGDYTLYVDLDPDRPWTAYCHDMAGEPRTYLSLIAVGEGRNFSQYSAPSSVRTAFTRVRIEPTTLAVDIDDLTFSSSSGALYHGETLVTAMPYGVAESCGWGQGVANIDLTGTPFKIASPFCTSGFEASGSVTLSEDDQVADVLGAGNCGWTSPTCSYGPHDLMNTVNGWILQLAYVEP
ncbi:GON domain-containing protein [Nannocystis radixulma]|uniref:GON domain-containing protein n=1 Tax=Nannocystis radixulma TaxID=2995305 RepID=A0ABT5BAY5_9BACT|nr:GON domain-containing protein [Nannocystis radixulma]MDC0670613.1 GON domain-containing protein [Nannocystis radixulma]